MKLIDTNILVYFFERNVHFFGKSCKLLMDPNEEFALSSLTYFELIHGTSPERRSELNQVLQEFVFFDVTKQIAEKAGILMEKFKKSRQVKIDALIAATALHHDIPLVTNNVKDFVWIPELQLEVL